MKRTISIIPLILLLTTAFAQQPDKAKYATSPAGFMQKEIMKDITGKEGEAPNRKSFVMDFDGKSYPTDPAKYTTVWHNEPVSQGLSGTCWAYSATSFIESEAYRKSGHQVKLSEMFRPRTHEKNHELKSANQ